MMVAAVSAITGGTGVNTWGSQSGWTALANAGSSNDVIFASYAKIADSSDVSASDFTFSPSASDTMGNAIGVIARVSTTNGFASVSDNIASQAAGQEVTPVGDSGVTTKSSSGVLLIAIAEERNDGNTDFSGYSVTNDDPTWSEEEDIYNEPSGLANNLGLASGDYNFQQATGSWSVDTDSTGAGALISVHENINVTINAGVLTASSSLQPESVSAGANVNVTTLSAQSSFNASTVSADASDPWTEVTKDTGVWSNVNRS